MFVALDMVDPAAAEAMAAQVRPHVAGVKLGLEFFAANGPAGVRRVAGAGLPLFLDLKLHDIPNTVAGAVRAVVPLEPSLLTVHAGGGPAMLRAARNAAADAGTLRPKIVAVTVLTSLDDADLGAVGQTGPATDQVRRLAALAQESGLDGVVCAPQEVAILRGDCGPDFLLVVPGIRPGGSAAADQKRVMTPTEAIAAGADILVVGRPITAAADPAAAARDIAGEIGR
ncbi:MAG: orotidine-5'-phosphate decarboxylase [Alphaproteobacteria bacterium]|nr:orotidine-5'-phosphate decarboxylase [Alphaproteobacteria bacterium]